ncbi:type VI immunity family protein [Corallococcus aberystwythensis]|uniref:type VI immunity family protein n=1 Tax=Corallococcus aberystwythensis TaxID=2316722 RepID=UPI0013156239|nr:type VI immunity family protein [Corallococcus aberystwythensis]
MEDASPPSLRPNSESCVNKYPLLQHFATTLPRVQLVMRIVFYLPHDHGVLAPVLRQALDTYLRFIAASGGALTSGDDPDISEDSFLLTPDAWEEVHKELEKARFGPLEDMDQDSFWFWTLTKRGFDTWVHLTGGESDPSGFEFSFRSRLPWREPSSEYSVLSVKVPMQYLEDQGPEKARDLAQALAELLPFNTGHAGLSLSFTRGRSRLLPLLRDQLVRHPGWDVPRESTWGMGDGIDGIHWLNFLGPLQLEAVGGIPALRSHLSHPETTVQELTGGRALISLGSAPLAGDTKLGETLPAYRELARFLEPWLLPSTPFTHFEGYTQEEARHWWRRFLEAPPVPVSNPRDG